ncbi:hypothetical protein C2E20_7570 [Micractinium conductrix]|uniref:Uncharacterized protein n=1 Tax=Micractinium conductrix TaxID=554055 RepID=A0A2P6V453_9CHLO|nr:hypothetical protein C2E20_7570 [Micractinium conductrix]|eukprot:PSC68859.1 hypothetical protein C2E20_7570 [Micractinium conductrix]
MFGVSGTNGGARGWAASPAAPQMHGMLLSDDRGFNKKAAARWAAAEQRLSQLSALLGAAIFLLSWRYLSHFTETTGQVLGGILMASGAVGYMGGRRRSANLTNAQLIACLVGTLLAFSFVSEVARDTQVDCALAELYSQGKATQLAVAGVAQQEALQAIFLRLNEMEDSLTLVQTGAAKQVELRQAQAALKDTDVTYIRNKVELVKAHAQQLLDSVLSNPNVTVTHIQKLSEEDKALLRRRMETADAVLDKLAKHESAEAPLTFEGYQQLLAMLTDADTVADAHPELQAAKAELPHFKAALERSSADAYHQLQVGDAPKQLAAIQAKREAQRKRFEQQFQQTLRKAEAKGQDYVSDLPEYCVKETHGETVMVTAGLAAVLTNVATAYVALSVSLRLPIGPKAA